MKVAKNFDVEVATVNGGARVRIEVSGQTIHYLTPQEARHLASVLQIAAAEARYEEAKEG